MRKSNTEKLGDIINESLKNLNIDTKLKEVKLIKSWEKVVGKTVAKYTSNIYIKEKKLFVNLNSSVVRNELIMIKDAILEVLNKEAGETIIKDIIIR
ncbi:MAG: DUF721 domain-containing protein [Bacteroidales bacterium]|nr:DUF721 domain-containing protein [Bacteroidales bacterium]